MKFVRELIVVAAAMLIIGNAGKAFGAECYQNAAAVRADHAGAWPSWSQRLPGHTGQRCWFASERKVMPHAGQHGRSSSISERLQTHDTRPRLTSPAGAVPIPRAMPFELTKERELERLIPFNERWAALGLSWR